MTVSFWVTDNGFVFSLTRAGGGYHTAFWEPTLNLAIQHLIQEVESQR